MELCVNTPHTSNPITWEAFQQICKQQQALVLTAKMSWRAVFFFRRETPVFIISPDSIRDSALAIALIEAYLYREPRLIEMAEVLDQTFIPNLAARLELARVKSCAP